MKDVEFRPSSPIRANVFQQGSHRPTQVGKAGAGSGDVGSRDLQRRVAEVFRSGQRLGRRRGLLPQLPGQGLARVDKPEGVTRGVGGAVRRQQLLEAQIVLGDVVHLLPQPLRSLRDADDPVARHKLHRADRTNPPLVPCHLLRVHWADVLCQGGGRTRHFGPRPHRLERRAADRAVADVVAVNQRMHRATIGRRLRYGCIGRHVARRHRRAQPRSAKGHRWVSTAPTILV